MQPMVKAKLLNWQHSLATVRLFTVELEPLRQSIISKINVCIPISTKAKISSKCFKFADCIFFTNKNQQTPCHKQLIDLVKTQIQKQPKYLSEDKDFTPVLSSHSFWKILDGKGQLISKGFLVFSILPKNERKISTPVGQGNNQHFQVRFLGELKTLKFSSEIM